MAAAEDDKPATATDSVDTATRKAAPAADNAVVATVNAAAATDNAAVATGTESAAVSTPSAGDFPPGLRIKLRGLKKNASLNGVSGIVMEGEAPDLPGTIKVKLENGQEVAVRPANLEHFSEDVNEVDD